MEDILKSEPSKLNFLKEIEGEGSIIPQGKEPENPKDIELENKKIENSKTNEKEEIETGNSKYIPVLTAKRFIKDNTEFNVSRGAAEELVSILEEVMESVVPVAEQLARSENMKTIKRRHVKSSFNSILKNRLAEVITSTKKTDMVVKKITTDLISAIILDIPEEGKDD